MAPPTTRLLVPPRLHSRRTRAGPLTPPLAVTAPVRCEAGERSRLINRPCPDARPDGGRSSSWKDYRDLVQTAHQRLGGPVVPVWDEAPSSTHEDLCR
jgi:hypothetical protein